MNGTTERVVRKNISLYPRDLVILHRVSQNMGLSSLSATIRYIIHDWSKKQQLGAFITVHGAAPDDDNR
jgi:hypothetical protein